MSEFSKEEMGMKERIGLKSDPKIIPPSTVPAVKTVEENYGQTMAEKNFQGAAKPWKPKGRK